MSSADFAAWVTMMKETRKWSALRCARELGISYNTLKAYLTKDPPDAIGFACTAIAQGWPQWRAPQ